MTKERIDTNYFGDNNFFPWAVKIRNGRGRLKCNLKPFSVGNFDILLSFTLNSLDRNVMGCFNKFSADYFYIN